MRSMYTAQTIRPAFAIGICLNLDFVVVEAFYGWQVFYLALLEDSGHKRLHGKCEAVTPNRDTV